MPLVACAVLGVHVGAAGRAEAVPIDAIVLTGTGILGDPSVLDSFTVAGELFPVGEMAQGVSTVTAGGNTNGADNFDVVDFLVNPTTAWNIDLRGLPAGGFINGNGMSVDFFLIDWGGNDDIDVRPILAYDGGGNPSLLGQPISFSGSGDWGGLGVIADTTITVGNGYETQELHGLAFSVTDLLDDSGTPLILGDLILGVQIDGIGSGVGAAGSGLDSGIFAVHLPEPSASALAVLVALALGARHARFRF